MEGFTRRGMGVDEKERVLDRIVGFRTFLGGWVSKVIVSVYKQSKRSNKTKSKKERERRKKGDSSSPQ